jgi:hypothetical protein
VRQPIVEKGRLAAALLVERINGRAAASPAPLSTRLVVRGSTSERNQVVRPAARPSSGGSADLPNHRGYIE